MSNPFVRRSRGVAETSLQAPQISRFQQILLAQGFVDTLLFTQPTGSVSEGMRAALRRYQRSRGLPETGELDPSTQDRLDREVGAPPPIPASTPAPAPAPAPAADQALAPAVPGAPAVPAPPAPQAGMSTGTKVAIAVGVTLAVALLAVAVTRSGDRGGGRS